MTVIRTLKTTKTRSPHWDAGRDSSCDVAQCLPIVERDSSIAKIGVGGGRTWWARFDVTIEALEMVLKRRWAGDGIRPSDRSAR